MRKSLPWVLMGSLLLPAMHVSIAAEATPPIPRFIEETDTAGLQSRFEGQDEFMVGGGVAVFDCDNDGLPEIYVTGGQNKAKFYRNKSARGGPVKLQEERSGLELTLATGAYPIDIDSDGHADLVVLRVGEIEVFKGLGSCKFERANAAWNIPSNNDWHTAFSATWEKGQTMPTLGHLYTWMAVAPRCIREKICRARVAQTQLLRTVHAFFGLEPKWTTLFAGQQ
jgi:enediyne biosynthesis protein E4